MKTSTTIGPSRRLDHWMRSSRFRDTIAVRSTATPERLLKSFEEVTLHEMPLARFLGFLRYVPALLSHGDAAQLDDQRPFLEGLTTGGGNLVLERARAADLAPSRAPRANRRLPASRRGARHQLPRRAAGARPL